MTGPRIERRPAGGGPSVLAILRERLANGHYKPGEELPKTQDLASEFEVARNVVNRAITQLRDEGYLSTKGGGSAFVNPRDSWPPLGPSAHV